MEFAELETNKKSTVHSSREIRLEDFHEYKGFEEKLFRQRYYHNNFEFYFCVSVYPNGLNKETEGWLVVLPELDCFDRRIRTEDYGALSCIVNVIDIEGNCRYPRYFRRDYGKSEFIREIGQEEEVKYLERSLILHREYEFLSNGVLTMRCDFYSDLDAIISSVPAWSSELNSDVLEYPIDELKPIEFAIGCTEEAQTGDLRNPFRAKWGKDFLVTDFTFKVLTLPQFHESRKRFGVYGIPLDSPSLSSESEKDIEVALEHIWMFDVFDNPSRRYLLSLDEGEDSLGSRLLKASPVIRRMVNADMRERREKCVELQNVKDETFLSVLNFLRFGVLKCSLQQIGVLEVYEFAHLYEMEDLQRACAESIVEAYKFHHPKKLKRLTHLYPDDYLSSLVELHRIRFEKLEEARLKTKDIPYSDCYI